MKRVYFYLALLLVLSLAIPAYADKAETGNGAPSGAHYNLNIIGVPKGKSATMDDNSGHRIFVNLDRRSKVMLREGEEFRVVDANGTDGNGAKFELPTADEDNDGVTEYSVWARALGKPGGTAKITTCIPDPDATDPQTFEEENICSMYTLSMVRTKGRSKFADVSKELLYIYADLDGDGAVERYPLFDDDLEGFFWDYNNNGLKLAQFRFYEMPSDVNEEEAILQP
jgi:hypothetical protein